MSMSLLGPGSYQPEASLTKARSKRTIISPARSKDLTAPTSGVGPGTYSTDMDSNFVRNAASFTIG